MIDTGYNTSYNELKLCNKGIDLTSTSMNDTKGHGNNISHIIANRLKNYDYCIFPIKAFVSLSSSDVKILTASLKIAYRYKPDIINMSYTGQGFDEEEYKIITKLLKNNIKLVVAAGNDHINLDTNCIYYPACYDPRIIVVGNLNNNDKPTNTSNYGIYVKKWNQGMNIEAGGYKMSGTSQATAIETANQALEMLK